YRQMAEDTVDVVVKRLGTKARCKTKRFKLLDETAQLDALARDDGLGAPLVAGLEYRRADAVFAARHEMVHTLTDVLARRTRALLLDRDATVAAAPDVAELVGKELGWSADETAAQLEQFNAIAAHENEAQHA